MLSITPSDRRFNLRHIAIFQLAKALQTAFGCQVLIHILDTKTSLRDPDVKWAAVVNMTMETIKDILSFEFNPTLTCILKNSDCLNMNYIMLCDLERNFKLGSFQELFLTSDAVSVSLVDIIFQNACFASPKYLQKLFPKFEETRCLMLLRPSQRNLFEAAKRISEQPPMAIFGGFIPALQSFERMPVLAKIAISEVADKKKDSALWTLPALGAGSCIPR
jgi:hypothetical protein